MEVPSAKPSLQRRARGGISFPPVIPARHLAGGPPPGRLASVPAIDWRLMKSWGAFVLSCLLAACADSSTGPGGDTSAEEPRDAALDACPPYRANDAGVVQLRRGCPLTIEYQIR
jgi:hypothetical protein